MWVAVAGGAVPCQRELVLDRAAGEGCRRFMTLGALDFGVETGERVRRAIVRESRRVFPRGLRVAFGTVRAQLAGVDIAMARRAGRVERGEGGIKVVPLQHLAIAGIDEFGCVALGAFELSMFAFQFPAGLSMVELFFGHRPTHDPMVEPIVFGVAAGAIVAARFFHLRRVISALL